MAEPVFSRRQALDRGLTDSRIHRSVRAGSLTRVRRGSLVTSRDWAELGAEARYRATVVAAYAACSTGAVLSHLSAAVVHGFPVLRPDYRVVHFSEHGSGGGHGGVRRLHRVALDPLFVTVVDGMAVTTAARTAVDVACTGTFEQAVCVVESALRSGVTRDELLSALAGIGRRRGIAVARRAVDFADGRTESIGESWSRALMGTWPDIPLPRLQHRFLGPDGRVVARTDFDWKERMVGEFDGLGKYGTGTSAAIIAERQRENRLQAMGILVVRWTWNDLRNPENLHGLLRDGLRRVGLLEA